MKKIIDTVALILTLVSAIGLLGSYTAPLIDPNDFYPSSLLGLAYHYLLPANLLLLLYWLARWRRVALIELLVILAGYPFFLVGTMAERTNSMTVVFPDSFGPWNTVSPGSTSNSLSLNAPNEPMDILRILMGTPPAWRRASPSPWTPARGAGRRSWT